MRGGARFVDTQRVGDPSTDWMRLWRTARGRPVNEVEHDSRELVARHELVGMDDYAIELTARAMADARWARHHPVDALAFAWRHRARGGFVQALRAICQPRFAG